jgi:toxin ParE1/3/4
MSGRARPYKLSPLAESDPEEIWLYTFRNWSVEQADRYQNQIIAAIEGMADGSKTGQPVPVRKGYYKYRAGSHFVFYRVSDASLDVIRILHQRMDIASRLQD